MEQIDFNRIPLYARRSTAARADVSPGVLDILASDPDDGVRMAVASNPATPLRSLQRLCGDAVARVAALARNRAAVVRAIGETAAL